MPIPKGVKISRDGVEYVDYTNATQYTMNELIRAALRDCGKLICTKAKQKIKKRTGRGKKNTQYWVRSKMDVPDLLVGYKPAGFYMGFQELGGETGIKMAYLSESTLESIDEIQKIQTHYLKELQSSTPELPSEDDMEGGE